MAAIQADMTSFRRAQGLDRLLMINLASTERLPDLAADAFGSVDAFERALDADDPEIGPAMLYAYAAIASSTPYGNFAPSHAADVRPLASLAERLNVPIAGKDGKTGQTLIKTVIAPALRARAACRRLVFDQHPGQQRRQGARRPALACVQARHQEERAGRNARLSVEDHVVHIHYYKPRGDDKEAWDNIDISGFLGRKMQLKINFLCKDSVLAAPLAIEIARVLDLAQQRGAGGVQEQLGLFFKAPQTAGGRDPVHAFPEQQRALDRWLEGAA